MLQARLGDSAEARRTAASIDDVRLRLRTLLLIDPGRLSDLQVEELLEWLLRRGQGPSGTARNLEDIDALYLRGRLPPAGEPKALIEALLDRARSLSDVLEEFRSLEGQWRDKRDA